MSTTPDLALAADFPAADDAQWRALVDKVLKGADFDRKLVSTTYDGIRIEPLYTRTDAHAVDGRPGQPDFRRGTAPAGPAFGAWDIRQIQAHPDPAEANRRILEDLDGGVSSLELVLDVAGAGDVNGIVVGGGADLATALDGVLLDLISVVLAAGPHGAAAAELLIERWEETGVAPDQRRGSLGLDPLGALAASGHLPAGIDPALAEAVALAARTADWPHVRALHVDAAPYSDAGASEVEELALVLATGVAYLGALVDAGHDVATASRQIAFTLSADADVFATIAKVRASRRLWSHALAAAGAADAADAPVSVRTAARMITARDPWVNMLRVTAACFAAGASGAASVTLHPFDAAIGQPDELARRIARNTQLILQEESHIGFVVDPAGGSYYVEDLTDRLTAAAWARFQEIQADGGLAASLASGAVGARLAELRERRRSNLATRRDPITGVSEFPHLGEPAVDRPAPDVAALRAAAAASWTGVPVVDTGSATTIEPLPKVGLADDYEALRDASDRHLAATGHRPRVFLANLDTVAVHTARATFAKNFFEAGGVEALGNDGFPDDDAVVAAFTASGCSMAVICSSDGVYADRAAPMAAALRSAGARRVYLAGNPGDLRDALGEAGVDEFIHIGVDVLASLRTAHETEGVAS